MAVPVRRRHTIACRKSLEIFGFFLLFSECQCCDSVRLRKKPDKAEPGVGKWVSYLNRERKLDSRVGRRPTAPPAPKGLYIYGNVGSGMLLCFLYMCIICKANVCQLESKFGTSIQERRCLWTCFLVPLKE